MTDTPHPTAPAMRPTLRWLLIGSLAINFLMLGLGIGAIVSGPHGGGPRAMELALGPFARALDDGDRRAIAREMMQRGDVRPPSRQDRMTVLTDLVAALRAEPFDPSRIRDLIDRQQTWVQSAQTAAQEAVLARIVAMSPEARLAFADRLSREIGDGRNEAGSDRSRPMGGAGG